MARGGEACVVGEPWLGEPPVLPLPVSWPLPKPPRARSSCCRYFRSRASRRSSEGRATTLSAARSKSAGIQARGREGSRVEYTVVELPATDMGLSCLSCVDDVVQKPTCVSFPSGGPKSFQTSPATARVRDVHTCNEQHRRGTNEAPGPPRSLTRELRGAFSCHLLVLDNGRAPRRGGGGFTSGQPSVGINNLSPRH